MRGVSMQMLRHQHMMLGRPHTTHTGQEAHSSSPAAKAPSGAIHTRTHALQVYGYSAAFGQAPHEVTAALLQRWFPFHAVEASYEGY
jgi:hypothetical protein